MRSSTIGSMVALLSVVTLVACGDDGKAVTKIGDNPDSGVKPVKTSKTSEPTATATPTTSTSSTTVSTATATASQSATAPAATNDAGVVVGGEDAGGGGQQNADASTNPPDEPSTVDCPPLEDREFVPVTTVDEDTVWSCDKLYLLTSNNNVLVTNNSTLSIEPGTVVMGEEGSALIVTVGSRLVAEGEKDAPIVFTSSKNVGERAPSQWGGVLLLGDAPLNARGGTSKAEGVNPTSAFATYGGSNEEADCGSLKYVRIEFAGFEFAKDKELNALGVAGCGSKTKLSYIQLHRGSDDGIEFWGGAPQVDHIVSSFNQDDSFDWTDGFHSKVQFLAIVQLGEDDNGFEGDNNATEFSLEPRTAPEFYNVTMIGATAIGKGMLLRRGTYLKAYNTIVTNFPSAIDVRTQECVDAANAGLLTVENSLFFHNNVGHSGQFSDESGYDPLTEVSDGTFDEATFFGDPSRHNQIDVDPGLGDVDPLNPNWVPPEGSPAATGAATPPAGYDTSAKYIGAFQPGGEDWTAGWTAYPEN